MRVMLSSWTSSQAINCQENKFGLWTDAARLSIQTGHGARASLRLGLPVGVPWRRLPALMPFAEEPRRLQGF